LPVTPENLRTGPVAPSLPPSISQPNVSASVIARAAVPTWFLWAFHTQNGRAYIF
jgi:hypothetical protein